MNTEEYEIEHRHVYETRLGILGLSGTDGPTAAQHNMAVAEADEHGSALKREERSALGNRLLDFRDNL